jgi:hypothetical protein
MFPEHMKALLLFAPQDLASASASREIRLVAAARVFVRK